jgi:hypothetical protein
MSKIILSIPAPIELKSPNDPSLFGGCDSYGYCYWGQFLKRGVWRWRSARECPEGFTHWLPAHSVALPTRVMAKPRRTIALPVRTTGYVRPS